VTEESSNNFSALITFISSDAVKVALLLNSAELGTERISVSVLPPTPSEDSTTTDIQNTLTALLQKSYRLTDDAIEAAINLDNKVNEVLLDPVIKTAGEAVIATYDATSQTLQQVQEMGTEVASKKRVKYLNQLLDSFHQQDK